MQRLSKLGDVILSMKDCSVAGMSFIGMLGYKAYEMTHLMTTHTKNIFNNFGYKVYEMTHFMTYVTMVKRCEEVIFFINNRQLECLLCVFIINATRLIYQCITVYYGTVSVSKCYPIVEENIYFFCSKLKILFCII